MIKISDAKPADIPAIEIVREKSWLKTYPNRQAGITVNDIKKQFNKARVRAKTRIIKKTLNTKSNSHFFVAKDNDVVVGFVSLSKESDWEVNALYVLPEHHRRGIGSKLMRKALSYIGLKPVYLMVTDYNFKAINFYKKLGFQETDYKEKKKLVSGKIMNLVKMVKSGL